MPKRGRRLGSRGKVRAHLGQNAPADVGLMVHENIRVTKILVKSHADESSRKNWHNTFSKLT
jgi:hypothetical protein